MWLAKKGDSVGIIRRTSPWKAEHVYALVLVTEWDEFRNMNLHQLKDLMSRPVLVYGRNLFDPQRITNLGWQCYSTRQ